MSLNPHLRPLAATDSLEHITDLLHRAYKPLADAGMRFLASWQGVEKTRERAIGPGKTTIVAEHGGDIVGVITLWQAMPGLECTYYLRPGVLVFGQFAVEPAMQGTGVGGKLLTHAEHLARERGATELACDTSEHATHLIDYYQRRGYVEVARMRWSQAVHGVNYASVVLSKRLQERLCPSDGR